MRIARNVPVPANDMAKLRAAARGEAAGRRSGRRRGAPSFYRDDRAWENPYAIKVSSHRQAVLPPLQQRPPQPTAAEARCLGKAMYTPPPAAAAAGGISEFGGGGRVLQLGREFKRAYKVSAGPWSPGLLWRIQYVVFWGGSRVTAAEAILRQPCAPHHHQQQQQWQHWQRRKQQ
jgi:hypothetical protein